MSTVDDEVQRVCAEIRAAELADMTRNLMLTGFPKVMAEVMAEKVMAELEQIAISGPRAWSLT
jgi:hypothetical protein